MLIGAALALAALAPARWMAQTVASLSGQRLELRDAHGSVWRGSAQLVLAGGRESRDRLALPGRLSWTVTGPGSGPGLMGLELSHPQALSAPIGLRGGLSTSGWWARLGTVAGAGGPVLQLPAAWLAGLGAPWNTLQPGGRIDLELRQLHLHGSWTTAPADVDVELRLALQDLRSRVSTLPVLGSYELLAAGHNQLDIRLQTLGTSALVLEGTGRWRRGERLEFHGVASASSGNEASLSNLLNIIGRRDGPRSVIHL